MPLRYDISEEGYTASAKRALTALNACKVVCIVLCRDDAGMTQAQVAAITGIDPVAISKIEYGKACGTYSDNQSQLPSGKERRIRASSGANGNRKDDTRSTLWIFGKPATLITWWMWK